MKGINTVSGIIIFIAMVLFPLISMKSTDISPHTSPTPDTSQKNEATAETVRIYRTEAKKTEIISAKEYVIGVVLAEMAAENHEEALKAQAVVAYTYMQYKKDARKNESYDVTDTHETDQAFLSVEQAKERFKDDYTAYREKIEKAVNSVLGQTVTYNSKPILAVCHSISGGKTESATNIWGGEYPYLQPVESVGDVLSPGYLSEKEVTADELKSALAKLNITTADDASDRLGKITRSDSGTVLKIELAGKELKGTDLRSALGLRSANFDVKYSDGKFCFTVRGYGHGVGMSQYGAQYMASNGSSYKDILLWYYTDCKLSQ